MNNRKFSWLIVMMVLSLAGITGIQLFWIRNAVDIRNENFDNTVITALHTAASNIEASNRFAFFSRPPYAGQAYSDTLLRIESSILRQGSYRISSSVQGSYLHAGDLAAEADQEFLFSGIIPEGDSVVILFSSGNRPPEGENTAEEESLAAGDMERRLVVGYDLYISWLRRRAMELQRLGEQMINELTEWDKTVTVDDRLVAFNLDRAFSMYGVKTPYEYAFIRDGKINGGHFSAENRTELLEGKYFVSLFPGRMIKEDVILSVIFPEKRLYLIGSMTFILASSLLFSLIILGTFSLSLFFIIRQKKVTEMRADFINNMTHEFKTPIATISLAADTIINPRVINDENNVRHFVGMIKKENSRMNRQVETILQIASLDRRDIQFRFGDVSLHPVIERAAETMELQVQQRGGTITLKLDAVDSVIYGDASHLSNLIGNLIDNANKYSGDSPDITISTCNRDDGVVISVVDKGAGMSKAAQQRVFERFYRQPAGNIHNVKGFGLGLSYVKSIVDAHKGVIELSSEPGKGSRFDVYLPFNWEG